MIRTSTNSDINDTDITVEPDHTDGHSTMAREGRANAEARPFRCAKDSALRWFHTGNVFLALFGMGSITAITGTTTMDLSFIFNEHLSAVMNLLTTRGVGILFGSLVCGNAIYRWVNARAVMVALLVAGGLGTALVPSVPALWLSHIGMLMTGISIGATEVGANVWLVQLWGEHVSPVMQTYHLSFGLGALFSPIVTRPFLSPAAKNTSEHLNYSVDSFPFNVSNINISAEDIVQGDDTTVSEIWLPYAIFGIAYSAMGLLMLVGLLCDWTDLRQIRSEDIELSVTQSTRRFDWTVVSLLAVYVLIDITVESCMSQTLSLYVVHNPYVDMSPSTASYLIALFWGMYTSGRIVAIVASFRIKPSVILVVSQSIAAVGCAVMFLLVVDPSRSSWAVWGGTATLAAGLAPLYGTSCTLAVQYIRLRHAHMSLVLVASCLGAMAPVYIVAPWVQKSTVQFPAVLVGLIATQGIVLAAMLLTTKGHKPIFDSEMRAALIENIGGLNRKR